MAAVLESYTAKRNPGAAQSGDLIPQKEFARMIHEMHEKESASNSRFIKAFSEGRLTREQVKRFGMEWYHYNMWMCPACYGTPNLPRDTSKQAYYTRLDNVEGEYGFKEWKPHPYLSADLALGATMDEVEAHIPLPTTIFYCRSNKGLEPGVLGAGAFLVEFDNQRCSSIIYEALGKHYGLDDDARRYFEIHKESDVEHTEEYFEVLVELCKTRADQEMALRKGAHSLRERCVCFNGWMALLDS